MTRIAGAALCVSMLLTAHDARSEEYYLYGNISNISSTPSGLLVMLDTGVPTNCTGVGYGWMTIPESNKAMIAVALLSWQTDRPATIFTNALAAGVCTVNQFDPQ